MTDRQFYKRMGICPNCRKRPIYERENSCFECKEKRVEYMRMKRLENPKLENFKTKEYKRLLWNKRRENGQCYRCGEVLTDLKYKTCRLCRMKANEWQKQRKFKVV